MNLTIKFRKIITIVQSFPISGQFIYVAPLQYNIKCGSADFLVELTSDNSNSFEFVLVSVIFVVVTFFK